MRLIDMQVSVNGTAPGGQQTTQAQALYTYRFLHDVDQARKTNLQRQESAQPAVATAASAALSDQAPLRVRSYTNRVKREEKEPERRSESGIYGGMMWKTKSSPSPQHIDFSA